MPAEWAQTEVRSRTGQFASGDFGRFIGNGGPELGRRSGLSGSPASWIGSPNRSAPSSYRLRGGELSLEIGGEWAYCDYCRTTQRPFPGSAKCVNCGRDGASRIDPDSDPVFAARKATIGPLQSGHLPPSTDRPMALIAAEHTAQLNAAQAEDVYSKAEEHELRFQDVDLGKRRPTTGSYRDRRPVVHYHDGGWDRHRGPFRGCPPQYASCSRQLSAASWASRPSSKFNRHGVGVR